MLGLCTMALWLCVSEHINQFNHERVVIRAVYLRANNIR